MTLPSKAPAHPPPPPIKNVPSLMFLLGTRKMEMFLCLRTLRKARPVTLDTFFLSIHRLVILQMMYGQKKILYI